MSNNKMEDGQTINTTAKKKRKKDTIDTQNITKLNIGKHDPH
jgi:hypothetical protein